MLSRLYRGIYGIIPTRRARSRVIPSRSRSGSRSRTRSRSKSQNKGFDPLHRVREGEIKEDYNDNVSESVHTRKVTKSSNPKHTILKRGKMMKLLAVNESESKESEIDPTEIEKKSKFGIGRANAGLDKDELNKLKFYIKHKYLLHDEKDHRIGLFFKYATEYQKAFDELLHKNTYSTMKRYREGLENLDKNIHYKLYKEQPILSLNLHGEYYLNTLETNKLKLTNPDKTLLKVPIIIISAIYLGEYTYFDYQNDNKYFELLNKLKYLNLLNKTTQDKQLDLVARDLRELFKTFIQKNINEFTEYIKRAKYRVNELLYMNQLPIDNPLILKKIGLRKESYFWQVQIDH
jgi:hypothetical protein